MKTIHKTETIDLSLCYEYRIVTPTISQHQRALRPCHPLDRYTISSYNGQFIVRLLLKRFSHFLLVIGCQYYCNRLPEDSSITRPVDSGVTKVGVTRALTDGVTYFFLKKTYDLFEPSKVI